MLELGISQAQAQFTKLLTQTVFIVDKKAHRKKAVIMPYEEYERLLKQSIQKENLEEGSFNKFVGILDNGFKTDDVKNRMILMNDIWESLESQNDKIESPSWHKDILDKRLEKIKQNKATYISLEELKSR